MRAWLVVLGLSSSGCGIVLQSVAGWREDETHREVRRRPLEIDTDPPGSMVLREGPDGIAAIGRGPIIDAVAYEVEVTTSTPKSGVLVVTTALEVVAGAIALGVCATIEGCLRIGAPIAATMGGGDLAFTLLAFAVTREVRVEEVELVGPSYVYSALAGPRGSLAVRVSGRAPKAIVLEGDRSEPPTRVRLPRGALISVVVTGTVGASADAALLLSGVEEVAHRAIVELGYRLTPPGIEPVPVRITVTRTDAVCEIELVLGTTPILAQAARGGPCRGDELPTETEAMIFELFQASD